MRHEPMLGQRLPCPKCKGPIDVPLTPPSPTTTVSNASATPVSSPGPKSAKPFPSAPPSSGPRGGAPIVDSTAMTKVGDVDWNELLAKEDLSTRTEADGESGPRFRHANEPDFIPLPPTFKPITPLPATAANIPINKQPWQSTATAKRRQLLTLATIGVAGSLLAIGGFVAFMRMVGTKDKPVVQLPTPDKGTALDNKPERENKLPELKKPEAIPAIDLAIVGNPEVPATDDPNGATVTPNPVSQTKGPESNPSKGSDPPIPPNALPSMSGDTPAQTANANGDEEILSSAFGSSIPQELVDTPMSSLSLRDNDIAELDIENAEVNRDQLFHPGPSAIPSWDKNSKFSISSFRVEKIGLLRCIDLFGRMAGVGISVDWQSCRIAAIDLTAKVDVNAENKSIAEMVAELIKERGLVLTIDPDGLPVVSASKEAMESKLPTDWTLVGIFPDGKEKQAGDDLLRLWGYDDVCQVTGGRLQWSDQATPMEKANMAATLCQLAKLRKVDKGPWSQIPDASLLFSINQWNRSVPCFERAISKSILAPEKRPIADTLVLAADKVQLNLVIDWQNIWKHGFSPAESAYTVVGGRKFPQIAKRFLNDYALELTPIGDDTVLLTTRDVRQRLFRVVPVLLPKNYKVDDLKQSLRELAPVVDDVSKFRVIPVAGTEDIFFARICSPRVDQLNDPDLILGLGWPDR